MTVNPDAMPLREAAHILKVSFVPARTHTIESILRPLCLLLTIILIFITIISTRSTGTVRQIPILRIRNRNRHEIRQVGAALEG